MHIAAAHQTTPFNSSAFWNCVALHQVATCSSVHKNTNNMSAKLTCASAIIGCHENKAIHWQEGFLWLSLSWSVSTSGTFAPCTTLKGNRNSSYISSLKRALQHSFSDEAFLSQPHGFMYLSILFYQYTWFLILWFNVQMYYSYLLCLKEPFMQWQLVTMVEWHLQWQFQANILCK